MSLVVILTQMGVIVILMVIGFICKKKGFVTSEQTKGMSWTVVNICGPCQTLSAVFTADTLPTKEQLAVGFFIVVILYGVMVLMGSVIGTVIRAPKSERRFYNAMTIFGNVGFIGIPLGQAILPSEAMPYLILFNLVYNPIFYTYGMHILRGDDEVSGKFNLKKLINPGFICSVLAIIVLLLNIQLPAVISNATLYAGNAVLFISLFVIGTNLADTNFKSILTNKCNYIFILLRQVAFPIVCVLVLKQFITDTNIISAVAIGLSVPVGNAPSMVAATNGCDLKTLTECTVFSTLLTVVTMTICLVVAI